MAAQSLLLSSFRQGHGEKLRQHDAVLQTHEKVYARKLVGTAMGGAVDLF